MSTATIGLFYGSDTGATEYAAELIETAFEVASIEKHDVHKVSAADFASYDRIILGLSTWFDGDLQSDWEGFFDEFKTIDFTGKKVAIFGLGDQMGYGEFFIDGVGILGQEVVNNGGEVIGVWSTEGYDYDESVAEFEPGWFMGLALDEDNQRDMTESRIAQWVAQLVEEFELEAVGSTT
ncbi:flavodoxin [Roseivirga pacifica]|uniref:flavodoxin n=1 Tax=Roseivirga pacifica TaxID=1267423 RepID=UPI003BAE611E